MAYINLLPWREEARQEDKQKFFIVLGGAAIIAVAIVAVVYIFFMQQLSMQTSRNSFLQTKIDVARKKIAQIENIKRDKQKLVAQINIIRALQGDRPKAVQLFDDVPRVVPDGLYLKLMKRTGNVVLFAGYAESNRRVAQMLRKLHGSDLFQTARDEYIRLDEKVKTQLNKRFEITGLLR